MNPFDYFYPVFSYADDKPSGVYEGAQMNQYSLWKGLHMVDGPSQRGEDWDPVRFSLAYKSMTATEEDEDLLCESVSLEEIDSLYNPGPEVPYNQILEAIVVNHYSRTEHRMKAVQRRIHAALAGAKDGDGQPLDILDPIVGKPKKSGSFATVTVQLPFTDGQVVSIVFHSPEVDRLRITADDEIIAFRWIMGRKDITQYVAPEEDPTIGGYREVPLATVAKRIAMLVAKNSAKFMGKAKKAAEDKAKLDAAESRVTALKNRADEIRDSMDTLQNDKSIEDNLGKASSELQALRAENTELEAQIAALKDAIADYKKMMEKTPKTDAGNAGTGDTGNGNGNQDGTAPNAGDPIMDEINAIIAGKYDSEGIDGVDARIDQVADMAEKSGRFDELENALNEAADHVSILMRQKFNGGK